MYDWDNRNVWLANNEDCGTNLVAIGTGPNAVPDLVGECGSDSTTTSGAPTSTETASESVTESVSSAETTADTTLSFSTTRYSNTTFTTSKPGSTSTGGSGNTYVLPTASAPSTTITSTVTTSKVYTVTACPPSVTDCPVGHVTTEIITSLTTYCPGSEATGVAPQPTKGPVKSTLTSTRVYTITSCPGSGSCNKGDVTTEIVHNTQIINPEQPTGVYTIPEAIQCGFGNFGCKEATTKGYRTVTITSVVKAPKPTPVPGYCTTCGPPGSNHHNNGTFTGHYTKPGYEQPTKGHATQDYPEPTGTASKPTGGNPLEELHTYKPTHVYAQPPNTVATVVKPTGTPVDSTPSEPTGTSPAIVNGASAWNVPALAAFIVGAFVAAL